MKNSKIDPEFFHNGGTYVSLGCVDFLQLLYGTFDEKLETELHFHGVDCSLVSIVRCRVLYRMLLNQAPTRSILQGM